MFRGAFVEATYYFHPLCCCLLQDLCVCGYSLAKLGLRPPATWLRRYCTLLLRLKGGLWHQKTLLTQVRPVAGAR